MNRKTALVTGASSGIGRELSLILAGNNYDLILVARRPDMLESVRSEITSTTSSSVVIIPKDLSVYGAADDIFLQLKANGLAPDVLVNNAGFGLYGEFAETDWVKEKLMIDLNITALTHLTKLLLPGMVKRKSGKILNVASTAAFQPGPNMAVYFATKAYVLSFSEALAEELSDSGITVTALCPGPTASEFANVADMNDSRLFKGKIPSAKEVARYGYDAMMKGQRVAIHGTRNYILVNAVRFSPRRLVTRIVKYMQGKVK